MSRFQSPLMNSADQVYFSDAFISLITRAIE